MILLAGCSSSLPFLQDGNKIVFFGDSITQLGIRPKGYITILAESLKTTFPNIECHGAGISGNKVTDLKARLNRDVLSKKPNCVVIYIGINDVWHWALPKLRGTPKDTFQFVLKEIIGTLKSNNISVLLCTPTVIGEKYDGTNAQDAMLDEYSQLIRFLASEMKIPLCDLRKVFLEYLKTNNTNNDEKGILTYDRVHLSDKGNEVVAEAMLKELRK
jgi:lysophospholipase L1-like esterase